MAPSDMTNSPARIELPEKTYFKIGEVAKLLEVEPYVLRYWETEFEVLDPEKTKSGQRVYQRADIELLMQIRSLLYEEMFTIAGARRQLELSRQGMRSYFDLQERVDRSDRGTAMADTQELQAELESARQELVAAQNGLRQTDQVLDAAQAEAEALRQQLEEAQAELEERPDPQVQALVVELQGEIAQLHALLKAERERSEAERKGQERSLREREGRRREMFTSLRREVESLAVLAEVGSRRG